MVNSKLFCITHHFHTSHSIQKIICYDNIEIDGAFEMTKFKCFTSIVFLSMLVSCSGLNNDFILGDREKSTEADYSEGKSGLTCKKKENSLFGLSRTCKNQTSFFANLSSNPDVDEPVAGSDKNDLKSNLQTNCKIKKNTLLGLSRTCNSSATLATSLSN